MTQGQKTEGLSLGSFFSSRTFHLVAAGGICYPRPQTHQVLRCMFLPRSFPRILRLVTDST